MIFRLGIRYSAIFRRIIFTVFFITNSLLLLGQQRVVKFKNYTKDNGLLHSYVLDIFQDSEGYIWAGSYGGLNRYDGTNLTGYNNKSEFKTPTNVIHKILEPTNSAGKALWMGTDNGLMKLDKRTMSFTLFEYGSTNILTMVEDRNGILWLGTDHKGLIKFDPKTEKYSKTALSKSGNDGWGEKISVIYKDVMGNLWMSGYNTGLIQYNPLNDAYERIQIDEHNPGRNTVNCIYKYQKKLMLGTNGGGVLLFDMTSRAFDELKYEKSDLLKIFPVVSGIAPDHEGDLWFATLGGGMYELKLKDGPNESTIISAIEQYTNNSCGAHSISNNILQKLYKDQTGNFWIGTLGGGLSYLDFYNHKFDHFQIQEDVTGFMDGTSVLSVGQNQEGVIWYGTQSEGVYTYTKDLKLLRHIPLTNFKNANNVVRQIYCDRNNYMWVTIDGGFWLISSDGRKQKYFDLSQYGLDFGNIHSIMVDSKNRLWFGVYEHGVYRVQLPNYAFDLSTNFKIEEHYKSTGKKGDLSSNLIWALYEDHEGQVWVGSDKGLDLYDPRTNKFKQILAKNVSCIMGSEKVKSSSIWVGTYGTGIYLLNKTDYSHINYNTDNGLSNDNINGILEDANGNIWVGTEKGLCSIDPSGFYNTDLSSLTTKQVNSSRTHCYYLQDGLQGHEFHLNANEQLKDGRLLFGGPNGFNIFDPQNIIVNTFVFPAKINDFKIHNTSIKFDTNFVGMPEYMDSISLSYKDNYFTIEFSQVCLSNPEHATYQYMLEGYDKDWITAKAFHGRITYTSFPEGDYLLKIKAINPDGYISDQISTLAIHIDSPWYRTLVFRISAIALFLILAGLFYRSFSIRNKRRHQSALNLQQEKFEKEKLQVDLDYRNRELSASAMYLVNRNEKLIEIKDQIEVAKRKADDKTKNEMDKVISLIDNVLKGKDNWENFEKNFNRIDTNFTKRLMEAYPALSNTDVKICTYMRMNLSSKEIAGLMNIASKSLETSRLRIRKKMGLESSIYLSDFILKF